MKSLLKHNSKLFFKNKFLCSVFVLLIISCNIFLIWALKNTPYEYLIEFLKVTQKLSIVGFIFFSFISYEYIMKADKVALKETVSAIDKTIVYLNQFLFLFIPITIYSMNLIAYNLGIYFYYNINYPLYLIHILKNIILNIFLVSVIGCLIGAIIGMKFKRLLAYGLLTLVIFCISPLFENIIFPFYLMTNNTPNPINLYPYWDVFRILPPDLDWIADKVYGLPVEACRWFLALFWICLLSSIFLSIVIKKYNKNRKITVLLLTTMMLLSFIFYLQPSSILRRDLRPDGVSYGDEMYARTLPEQVIEPNFNVLSYNMILDTFRKLNASVTMVIKPEEAIDIYQFTLYRGYNIKKITDADGQELNFTRNGNYFDVVANFDDREAKINVQYSGNGNKYYSNYQGIALPGYFPYYPMAGHLKMWDENTGDIYVNTDFTPKKFSVEVKSPLNIVSNLECVDNKFTGISQSVTLVGGFIVEENINGINATNEIIGSIDNIGLTQVDAEWKNVKTLIGETRNINFNTKKIIRLPHTIYGAAGSKNEVFVYFDDHILTMHHDSKFICNLFIKTLIPDNEEKQLIKEMFLTYIFDKQAFINNHENNRPSYDAIVLLKDRHKLMQDNLMQYNKIKKQFENLFLAKINGLGEEYMIQSTYQYLLDENNKENEVDFLYNLEVAK